MSNEPSMSDPFTEYSELLEDLDATSEEATDRMWELFEDAITNYTVESILSIFHLNLIANQKKYADLIDFYEQKYNPFDDMNMHEYYHHERAPDLNSTSISTGSGTAETDRNQTRTTTSTPGVSTTTVHSVNPFNDTGMKSESQDVTSESGSGTVSESYTGDPDRTETSSTAETTTRTTGSDLNVYTKDIHGRTGKRPTSEVIQDGMLAAAMHDVLDVIINDLADQIFLQVWI